METITGNRMSATEAEASGFTIDRHIYPWVAYKGARFAPDDSFPIYPERDPSQPGRVQAIVTASPVDLRWASGTVLPNGTGRVELAGCSILHENPVELADALQRICLDLLTAAGEREQSEAERRVQAEQGIAAARQSLQDGLAGERAGAV